MIDHVTQDLERVDNGDHVLAMDFAHAEVVDLHVVEQRHSAPDQAAQMVVNVRANPWSPGCGLGDALVRRHEPVARRDEVLVGCLDVPSRRLDIGSLFYRSEHVFRLERLRVR